MSQPTAANDDLLGRYAAVATADISDADPEAGIMDPGLRAVWTGARFAGRAATVAVPPGDNLGVREALTQLRPGDVLVVDAGGHLGHALVGELMGTRAQNQGAVGLLIDGAVRDAERLGALRISVFARGVTPRGPARIETGRHGGVVVVGGVRVAPGDVVVGDGDGVVVIAAGRAAATIVAAEHLRDHHPELHILDAEA